jgi:hypothetical protein
VVQLLTPSTKQLQPVRKVTNMGYTQINNKIFSCDQIVAWEVLTQSEIKQDQALFDNLNQATARDDMEAVIVANTYDGDAFYLVYFPGNIQFIVFDGIPSNI